MVTMAESAANWCNTHTLVGRTHSLTHVHQHSCSHFVRSASSAITEFWIEFYFEGAWGDFNHKRLLLVLFESLPIAKCMQLKLLKTWSVKSSENILRSLTLMGNHTSPIGFSGPGLEATPLFGEAGKVDMIGLMVWQSGQEFDTRKHPHNVSPKLPPPLKAARQSPLHRAVAAKK